MKCNPIAVLFDIDGTLLDMKGAGRRAFARAVSRVLETRDDLSYVDFAGNTDLNVLRQVFAHHAREPSDAEFRRIVERMPVELEDEVRDEDFVIFPGVRALLERLADEPRVILGLVTGNVEACARIKLRQFDLHEHFVLGAFGDTSADRDEIARHAWRRVVEYAGCVPDRAALIGDTPYDIRAARAIGVRAIGVATGRFGASALKAAGADEVFVDLSESRGVLDALGLS